MCSVHTFACNRFLFFSSDSHLNTHPLTPLHLVTRIEAAKRHWRAHWACRLRLAHPGMRMVEDHPSRLLSPGCLGQFMTPTKGDCTVDTLESKWLSHRPAALLPASIQGFTCICLFQKCFLVTIISVINHSCKRSLFQVLKHPQPVYSMICIL